MPGAGAVARKKAAARERAEHDPNARGLQRNFLDSLIAKRVEISTVESLWTGTLLGFDTYSILLDPDRVSPDDDHTPHGPVLIYKHTVTWVRGNARTQEAV